MGWVSLHIGHSDFLSERSLFEDSWSYFPEPWGRGWLGAAGESKEGLGGRESWSPGWSRAGAWLQWWRQADRSTYPAWGLAVYSMPCLRTPSSSYFDNKMYLSPTLGISERGRKCPRSEGGLVRGSVVNPQAWLQPVFALWSIERPYSRLRKAQNMTFSCEFFQFLNTGCSL